MSVPGNLEHALLSHFSARASQWGVHALAKQKIQASQQRSRTPDICVVVGKRPSEEILRQPPLICIEVISNSDMQIEMQHRIDDYLSFGVPHVWLLDPYNHRAWRCNEQGATEIKDGVLRTENPSIEVTLAEVFSGPGGPS